MSNLMMEFAMMSKKDYYKEFIENDVIRVIFGYKNEKKYDSDDYFEMSLRVWVGKEYFDEFLNNPKVENNMEVVKLFMETPFFKELTEQIIKIDFENWDFIIPDFFKKHNIKIIPYFQLGNNENLSPKQFFMFLKELKVKELKYITTILCSKSIEDEYKFLHKKF
ncbi:hypothetical protein A0M79_09585 [Campylobacter jejuni]|uniref:hypothetical protein n=1 Tax=Campylobacter jejuni TaxID=197 RepID=UPI000874740D|nr:hypothetical protein [Campylobacter jejuni]OEX31123.1 hypothetical protein A0M79_09585 [Campylobacter jejuni]